MALIKTFEKNNLDPNLLIKDTGLNLNQLYKTQHFHHWRQFVLMLSNCEKYLGPQKAALEIGLYGVKNEHLNPLAKLTFGIVRLSSIYWGMSVYVCKHFYNDCVKFNYKKLSSNSVKIEITINQELADSPLLLNSYIYVFENLPLILGLKKANVEASISHHCASYIISYQHTSYFNLLWKRIGTFFKGHDSIFEFMGKLEEKSIESAKLAEEKSKLVRILTHDVAGQINATEFYLKNLQKENNLEFNQQKSINKALESTRNVIAIINNIQNLEYNNVKGVSFEFVDIDFLFQALEEDFSRELHDKKIILKLKNDLPIKVGIIGNKEILRLNILGNLISNAIKFSPEHSEVIIHAQLIDHHIILSIIDQGRGIDIHQQSHLFQGEINLSQLGTRGEKGTGFGLLIAKQYTYLLDGKISMRSNYPSGSIFSVEFKMALPEFTGTKNLEFNRPNFIN